MIFESHAHYDDEAFDADREELLSGMRENGIEYILNVSSGIDSVAKTIELIRKYPFLYGAVGIHPSETKALDESRMEWLRDRCAEEKVVAVGEIGLDYHWSEPDRETQKKWFVRQLELASETGLPIIIHSRDAAGDTLGILREFHAERFGGVIHCFSYGKEMAKEYLKMGFYIGVGGVVTFQNGRKLKETVEEIPIESILLETDSPYLAPVPHRGKRNTSLNLPLIAAQIGEIKNLSAETVIEVTGQNARRCFRKGKYAVAGES